MHEWKYQEAAAEQLSPGAVRRLRARFVAVLRTIQTHGDGAVPSNGQRSGAGITRGDPPRSAPVAASRCTQETGWLQPAAESQPRSKGVLRERRSGNAPHVPPPPSRSCGSGGCAADNGGGGDDPDDSDGDDGGDDSDGGVTEPPPTPFPGPRESSTPFSEHAATDRELLAGWLGSLSTGLS